MRIDGFPSYPSIRAARSAGAIPVYGEAPHQVEPQHARQVVVSASSQDLEREPPSQVESANPAGNMNMRLAAQSWTSQVHTIGLSSVIARALASYTSTAGMTPEADAYGVLGIDIHV
ncbi:hypothetical protein [Azomonas macrocytogenes]|uniref:Uncharacterized protein n=1 Tax=Azomonas macrocytogenes TaxID=69962 RepID=A0A839T0D5_AZOMA|nr:hypothetical protein [Azomonas macrocytogenes]MBB3101976.1 hypothetical protein [Azomonas macrocytogenes]